LSYRLPLQYIIEGCCDLLPQLNQLLAIPSDDQIRNLRVNFLAYVLFQLSNDLLLLSIITFALFYLLARCYLLLLHMSIESHADGQTVFESLAANDLDEFEEQISEFTLDRLYLFLAALHQHLCHL
jgi:hypothetical protein